MALKNITHKELGMLALKEATRLRKLATKEEKERLNIGQLDGNSSTYCIYGLMTDNCWSDRATELIKGTKSPGINNLSTYLNSISLSPKAVTNYHTRKFTPLEVYIFRTTKSKQKQIIDYIKGKRKTFTP